MMNTRYQRILAALDGEATQRLVLKRAIELAKESGASLQLVHVIDCMTSESYGICIDEVCAEAKAALEEDLADLLEEARSCESIPACELKVCVGRALGVLLDSVVKDYEPNLIVCGDRGLSDLKYVFLGSVSAGLVRHAECDVLVVKNKVS